MFRWGGGGSAGVPSSASAAPPLDPAPSCGCVLALSLQRSRTKGTLRNAQLETVKPFCSCSLPYFARFNEAELSNRSFWSALTEQSKWYVSAPHFEQVAGWDSRGHERQSANENPQQLNSPLPLHQCCLRCCRVPFLLTNNIFIQSI